MLKNKIGRRRQDSRTQAVGLFARLLNTHYITNYSLIYIA